MIGNVKIVNDVELSSTVKELNENGYTILKVNAKPNGLVEIIYKKEDNRQLILG